MKTLMKSCVLLLFLSCHAAEPNIVWIIAEDMSPDLGCYGNQAVTTPHLDGLAQRGMKFNRMFTNGPACSPSRTALATGVFQTTIGAYHMRYSDALRPRLPEPITIIPEVMRKLGYYTGNIKNIGKTGTGKDDWLFQTEQKSWDTHDWKELIKHQPFYAHININESHRPFKSKSSISVKIDNMKIPPYYPDHPVTRSDWAGYLSEVNIVDEHVGDIIAQLEKDNLADSTIFIFISDHGRPMTRGKNWLYDSGTNIPFLLYIPTALQSPERYRAGTSDDTLLSGVDLVAETILLAGGTVPSWMQGRSFLRADSQPRSFVATAADRFGNVDSCSRAIRTERYKYIRNFKTPGSIVASATPYRMASHPLFHLMTIMGERGLLNEVQAQLVKPLVPEELYDLEKDPFETTNLIGVESYQATHAELKKQLESWMADSKDRGLDQDSAEIIEHFHNYGLESMKKYQKSIDKLHAEVERYFEK